MDELKNSALAFQSLCQYTYDFEISHKNKIKNLTIKFEPIHFHHLAGLHKLKDISYLYVGSRQKIFDAILNDKITIEDIYKSSFSSQSIDRIKIIPYLEEILDSTDLIFRFNKQPFQQSKMEADFIIEYIINDKKSYVFIRQENNHYILPSLFFKSNFDFTRNQPQYVVRKRSKHATDNR